MKTTVRTCAVRRGVRILATCLIALSLTAPLLGQSNPCAAPFNNLKDGIYNRYKEKTSFNKYSSMKDYFKSEDFKQDVKKGGWSGGITIPIKGVPVALNASSSKEDFDEFRSGIEKLSENQLVEAFGREIEKSEPSTDFVKQYFQCLRDNSKGFTWTAERIGKRAYLTIRFMPVSAFTQMPVLQNVKFDNATDTSVSAKEGKPLDFETHISAAPKDTQQPVTVEMFTDQGAVVASSSPSPAPTAAPTAAPVKSLAEQIRDGANFEVTFKHLSKPTAQGIHNGWELDGFYRESGNEWAVSSPQHPTHPYQRFTWGFPGDGKQIMKQKGGPVNPMDHKMSLWGTVFTFDDTGKVYDPFQSGGVVGELRIPAVQ